MFGGFSINSADTRAKLLWDNSSFHLFASERLPVCLIHLYRAKPRSPINSWEFCHWLLHDQGLACSKGKKKRRKLEAASPSGEWQAAHHLRATAWTKAGEQGAVLWAHIGLTLPWLPRLPGDAMLVGRLHHYWSWRRQPHKQCYQLLGAAGLKLKKSGWVGEAHLAAHWLKVLWLTDSTNIFQKPLFFPGASSGGTFTTGPWQVPLCWDVLASLGCWDNHKRAFWKGLCISPFPTRRKVPLQVHSRYFWKFKGRKTTVNNTSLSALQKINSCLRVQKPRLKQSRVMLDGVTPGTHTAHSTGTHTAHSSGSSRRRRGRGGSISYRNLPGTEGFQVWVPCYHVFSVAFA